MKQETLKEVAKECLMNNSLPTDGDFAEGYITGSIFGAKWQQEQNKNKLKLAEHLYEVVYKEKERMYSEEEVLEIFKQAQLCSVKADGVYFKYETFEQFKNK